MGTRRARRFRRYQGRHKVLLINEIGCFSVWVFIGCRICFGFGSSGLVMKSDLFRILGSLLMRYGWSAFYGGICLQRSAFRGTWLYNKSSDREIEKTIN